MNFHVRLVSGDSAHFKGNSTYQVSDAGVLSVIRHDRSRFMYPPQAWLELRESPGPDARDFEDPSGLDH